MIFVVVYEDGPCAWHRREVQVEALDESMARYKLLNVCPTAMITSVKPLGESK